MRTFFAILFIVGCIAENGYCVVHRSKKWQKPYKQYIDERRLRDSEDIGVVCHIGIPQHPDPGETNSKEHCETGDDSGVWCEIEFSAATFDGCNRKDPDDERRGKIGKYSIESERSHDQCSDCEDTDYGNDLVPHRSMCALRNIINILPK